MNHKPRSIAHTLAAVLVLGACLTGSAHAVDLRSWDQKFDNAGQRFVVLNAFNSEAVLDKETQLLWQRAPGSQNVTYSDAFIRCGRSLVGGRAGWRLPTAAELMSLIDPSIMDANRVGLPSGHPFTGVRTQWQGGYWSLDNWPTVSHAKVSVVMVGRLSGSAGAWGGQSTAYTNPGAAAWCVRGPTSQVL